ncbi:MAG: MucR family transcriptional regulator, partial [Candidimonas sp.]
MSNTNNLPATVAADAATVDATVATVAAAYFSANTVAPSDIATVIDSIRNSLTGKVEEPVVELTPAVSVKKSVTPDFIICLEDGKKLKMLKRHLKSTYNMTPDE